jgi:hypothetical protein
VEFLKLRTVFEIDTMTKWWPLGMAFQVGSTKCAQDDRTPSLCCAMPMMSLSSEFNVLPFYSCINCKNNSHSVIHHISLKLLEFI